MPSMWKFFFPLLQQLICSALLFLSRDLFWGTKPMGQTTGQFRCVWMVRWFLRSVVTTKSYLWGTPNKFIQRSFFRAFSLHKTGPCYLFKEIWTKHLAYVLKIIEIFLRVPFSNETWNIWQLTFSACEIFKFCVFLYLSQNINWVLLSE